MAGFSIATAGPTATTITFSSMSPRLRDIPINVVHGRYDRVCHLYQAEALVRALRYAGNNAVNYFITTAGHSSFESETDTRLRTIMNELRPMAPPCNGDGADQRVEYGASRRTSAAGLSSRSPS